MSKTHSNGQCFNESEWKFYNANRKTVGDLVKNLVLSASIGVADQSVWLPIQEHSVVTV